MNTKVIFVLGLIFLAVAVFFYKKQETKPVKPVVQKPTTSYEVAEIKAVQTGDDGKTEYTLEAKSLQRNAQTGQDEMQGITMDWQPPKGEVYHIVAGRATLNQETGEMHLLDGFVLTRMANKNKAELVIKGLALSGNTKSRILNSETPITVNEGENHFSAQGMTANLSAGEYEFSHIMVEFNPPKRKDERLF